MKTDPVRSKIMRSIKSKNTGPERTVAKILRKHGCKYRQNVKHMPGKPDFLLCGTGTVIFVNGCFWHGHRRHFRMPKTNVDFWRNKIETNRKRDLRVRRELRKMGFEVKTVWECELRKNPELEVMKLFPDGGLP